MGELIITKSGTKWRYMFEGARIAGKRQRISKSGFKTKSEALKAGTKALNEYNNAGIVFRPSEASVSDFYDEWLNSYGSVNLKEKTIYSYRKKVNKYIKPAIGQYRLASLSPLVLQNLINDWFNSGISRNTLSCLKGLLTGPLDWAVNPMQYIQYNPAKAVKLPGRRAVSEIPSKKSPHIVITEDQWQSLISRFPEGHPCHIPLMLGYYAGLRLGEAYGLTWEDIDFKTATLSVNRQVQYHEDEEAADPSNYKRRTALQDIYFTDPKYESFRTFKISSKLCQLLERTYKLQKKSRLRYAEYYTVYSKDEKGFLRPSTIGADDNIHLVNIRENGTYIRPRTIQHVIRVAKNELNIKDFDFHSLRKTHITRLLEGNAAIKDVQYRAGHKTLKETLEIYAEVTTAMENKSLDVLENMA